ncbi:MAG: type II toxin-antitoxin system VapC family toxin [Longimicrobiales bacterium]
MIVIDASAILEVLLRTGAAAAIEARLFGGETLHAPHMLDLEVAQVLRRYERAGELGARRGREALDDLEAFSIERYPHYLFLQRIWSLRANATAYDACYLALAEALDAPLLTTDRRMAGVPGHDAYVEVIERSSKGAI